MARCCYCGNFTHKNSGRTFHKFPLKNKKLLERWLERLPLKNWRPKKDSIICSDHFAEDCLDKTGLRTRLTVNSVPTIFEDPYGVCVYCRRKRGPNERHIFFKFPHDRPGLLRKWIENINIPGWSPKAESIICCGHFEPSAMELRGKYVTLKEDSVPTIFSNENKSNLALNRGENGLEMELENSGGFDCDGAQKVDDFDIEKIFIDFPDNKFGFFGESSDAVIPSFCGEAGDDFEGLVVLENKEGGGGRDCDALISNYDSSSSTNAASACSPHDHAYNYDDSSSMTEKIAEYQKIIEEKDKIIDSQERKVKQLQNRISSFKEVIFELCRDRSVSQSRSRSSDRFDGEN